MNLVFSVIMFFVSFNALSLNKLSFKFFNNIVKYNGRLIVKSFIDVGLLYIAFVFFVILLIMNRTFFLENIFCLKTPISLFLECFIFLNLLHSSLFFSDGLYIFMITLLFCYHHKVFVYFNSGIICFLFIRTVQFFYKTLIKVFSRALTFFEYFFGHYARKGWFFSCKIKRVII